MAYLGAHLKVFIYAAIAAWLAMWLLGYDIMQPKDFLSILGVAYMGFAFVKAMATRAMPAEPAAK